MTRLEMLNILKTKHNTFNPENKFWYGKLEFGFVWVHLGEKVFKIKLEYLIDNNLKYLINKCENL